MAQKKVLVCGATGFIGRNLLDQLQNDPEYALTGVYHTSEPDAELRHRPGLRLVRADLREPQQVEDCVRGMDIVVQAAATTSGARDIVARPYIHVTDNVVMNAHLFRACFHQKVGQVVFFSCTTMYPSSKTPAREIDFTHEILDRYFAVGWTKVYNEKMCEFYAKLGPTRYTVLRHSNIYGPFDKYDLERSHVFGATVTKVMTAPDPGEVVVWGEGTELRDLLHVDDLVAIVRQALKVQQTPFALVNVGAGQSWSTGEVVQRIIRASGKNLTIRYDRTKPTLNYDIVLNIDRAREVFGWQPAVSLDVGIERTLEWYRRNRP